MRSFILSAVSSPPQSSCHPTLLFFPLSSFSSPLYSEHFISPCHLFFFYLNLSSSLGSYSIHQTKIQNCLTVSAFLSGGLDLSISFLSYFASLSLSHGLFPLSIFLQSFCIFSSFIPFLPLSPYHSPQHCLLCFYFDLSLQACDKRPVLQLLSVWEYIFRYVSFALIGPPEFGMISTVLLCFGGNILILLSSGCKGLLPQGFYNIDPTFPTYWEQSAESSLRMIQHILDCSVGDWSYCL